MNRVPCRNCGRKSAYSEADLIRVRAKAARVELPPMVPDLCLRCALGDPGFRAEFDAWAERNSTSLLAPIRGAILRVLEHIDRFVEQLR